MIRLATRGSALARWQADEVARLLVGRHPGLEIAQVIVETLGDRRLDREIAELGGQGVFVKDVETAVLSGRADAAVHSAKDLPSTTAPGLALAALPCRADPRDALVGATLADLAPGSIVATGSVRRRAQLAALRPDLHFVGLRGNIATRLDRVPAGGAVVVAQAALDRLGLAGRSSEILAPSVMLPQVGQGAIAVECREDDQTVRELLGAIDDPVVSTTVGAERAFLARLGAGGCDLPVGGHAHVDDAGVLRLVGLVASVDGRRVLRRQLQAPVGPVGSVGRGGGGGVEDLGITLADRLLDGGARALLSPSVATLAPGRDGFG